MKPLVLARIGTTLASVASTKYDERPDSSSRELFSQTAVEAFDGTEIVTRRAPVPIIVLS